MKDKGIYFQTLQRSNDTKTIYSDKAISKSTGLHEWNIKCMESHPNDQIGIISRLDNLPRMRFLFDHSFEDDHDCYFWWGDEGIYQNSDPISNVEWGSGTDWRRGDVITVQLDSDKWILRFFKNEEPVYDQIKLENAGDDSTFYPVLYCGGFSSHAEYANIITLQGAGV